jgi:hypothetical protein
MKSVHIRDVDPEVLQRLRRLARLHHRSLQGELRTILEDAARRLPDESLSELNLYTVSEEPGSSWRREEIYNDDAR